MTNEERPAGAPRTYRLFGLTLRSEIELPELREVPPTEPDVRISRAPVAPAEGERVLGLAMRGAEAVVSVDSVARYAIRDEATIDVEALPDASERNVRLFLLGSAMGALLHRRGIFPLHANAIEVDGRAIAFAGASGAGKSTLAAAFHDRGYRILSDDICAITPGEGGFVAQPGIPRVRLWRDAVERTGRVAEEFDEAFDGIDKFVVPIDDGHADEPLELDAVFFLASSDDSGRAPEIRPLRPAQGAHQLIANTYRGAYVPLVGDRSVFFEKCLAIARAVPLFELHRPWDHGRIDETVKVIEAHLARG